MASFAFNFGGTDDGGADADADASALGATSASAARRSADGDPGQGSGGQPGAGAEPATAAANDGMGSKDSVYDMPCSELQAPEISAEDKAAMLKNAAILARFAGGVVLRGVDPNLAENEIAALSHAAAAATADKDGGAGSQASGGAAVNAPAATTATAAATAVATAVAVSKTTQSEVLEASALDSDLVAGKYEGGMKVWECSMDLVNLMIHDAVQCDGKRVLELGCGAGFPGVYALTQGGLVDFQDYNVEVLQHVTSPNVALNTPEEGAGYSPRYFAGAWTTLPQFLSSEACAGHGDGTYDIILTSETIYSLGAIQTLYDTLKRCIRPNGVVYVASKTYYFGVGGGTRSLQTLNDERQSFAIVSAWKSTTGVAREILELHPR